MKDPVEKTLEVGVVLSFAALIFVVSFQILSRIFFPEFSQIWTEEVTRFLFIYSVALASPLALKKKAFINVDLINYAPKGFFVVVSVICQLVVIALFAVLFYKGLDFTKLGVFQRARTINFPIAYIYAAIPLMGFLMTGYGVYNLFYFLNHIRKGGSAKQW